MVSTADDVGESRAIAWIFYYLGVIDGASATLEIFKELNPEPLNDAEWQTELRNYLPPELAALRQRHANRETAAKMIAQEFKEMLLRRKRHSERRGARKEARRPLS